ncbi:SET domain-containing protein [Bryobacter aggregatus]|uniref:SET domain-containing protein n=1 Tax=Bryobacter aggregatus TaxID=360054 RepID=UPI0004E1BC99|nr:SET domain-containing protein-lysine N-methyltransferase [Bryobacter aggregatus]
MKAKGIGAAPQIAKEFCKFRLEVRPSKIHRWGVFALEAIPKGRKVMEYTGKLVSRKEGKRRAESNQIHCLFTVDPYWYIDGAEGGSGAEFVNHCCEPSLESRVEKRQVFYFALRDIQAGEELSLDYHFGKNQERVVCGCGSPKCRGTINLLE